MCSYTYLNELTEAFWIILITSIMLHTNLLSYLTYYVSIFSLQIRATNAARVGGKVKGVTKELGRKEGGKAIKINSMAIFLISYVFTLGKMKCSPKMAVLAL